MDSMDIMKEMEGEVVLVTGGGTGIGLAMARAFAETGAAVCITGRREKVLKEALQGLGDKATACAGDVTIAVDRERILAHTERELGGTVSILVNNAGQGLWKPALDVTDEEFEQVLATHVRAAFALARDVAPGMVEKGKGSILFMASMASFMGVPNIIAYTAAKTAVLGLVRGLAAEWSAKGIRVNAIAPGWIRTPMTDQAFERNPARKEKVLGRTPMDKLGTPEDIARAALYLCSQDAGFITGQCLNVDGGASIGF